MSQSNKLAIPALKPGDNPALYAIKNQLEVINGTIGGRMSPLPPLATGATLAQCVVSINACIAAINQIIARLNA